MPYTFHAPAPTRYPSADSLFPASAETLTWYPPPYVDEAQQRAERMRDRAVAFIRARGGDARVSDVVAHVGGDDDARDVVRRIIEDGKARKELRRPKWRTRKNRADADHTTTWLVLP